jgi:hypothetical protein
MFLIKAKEHGRRHAGVCGEYVPISQQEVRRTGMAADLLTAARSESGRALGDDAVLFCEEGANSRVEEIVAQDNRHDIQVRVDGQRG